MKKHFGSLMKGMPHLVSWGAFLTLFSFSVQAQKAGLELKDGRSIEIIISAHSDKTLFTNSGNYKMAEILKAHFQVKQPMDERLYGFLKANSVDDNGIGRVEERSNFFLYIGKLDNEKGITCFLKSTKVFNYQLEIIGDGPLKKEIEAIHQKGGFNLYKFIADK